MSPLVVFVAFLAAAVAIELPHPSTFAKVFNEDQFEDYLDSWLAQEEPKWANASLFGHSKISPRSGNYILYRIR